MRTLVATDAHDHKADIAKKQKWLGNVNIATSPTFKMAD